MRKNLTLLLLTALLATIASPTIIITHSTPRFFQLSSTKTAIVIDEDEQQALDTLNHASQQQSTPGGIYSQGQTQQQGQTQYFTSQEEHQNMRDAFGLPEETEGSHQQNQSSTQQNKESQNTEEATVIPENIVPVTPTKTLENTSEEASTTVETEDQTKEPITVSATQNQQSVAIPVSDSLEGGSVGKVGLSSPVLTTYQSQEQAPILSAIHTSALTSNEETNAPVPTLLATPSSEDTAETPTIKASSQSSEESKESSPILTTSVVQNAEDGTSTAYTYQKNFLPSSSSDSPSQMHINKLISTIIPTVSAIKADQQKQNSEQSTVSAQDPTVSAQKPTVSALEETNSSEIQIVKPQIIQATGFTRDTKPQVSIQEPSDKKVTEESNITEQIQPKSAYQTRLVKPEPRPLIINESIEQSNETEASSLIDEKTTENEPQILQSTRFIKPQVKPLIITQTTQLGNETQTQPENITQNKQNTTKPQIIYATGFRKPVIEPLILKNNLTEEVEEKNGTGIVEPQVIDSTVPKKPQLLPEERNEEVNSTGLEEPVELDLSSEEKENLTQIKPQIVSSLPHLSLTKQASLPTTTSSSTQDILSSEEVPTLKMTSNLSSEPAESSTTSSTSSGQSALTTSSGSSSLTTKNIKLTRSSGPTLASLMSSAPQAVEDLSVEVGGNSGIVVQH